jgi:3-polyprenyl-4-hydroxybenzoate decarboxylase
MDKKAPIAGASNSVDFEAFRLGKVVELLHSHGELVYNDDPVDLIDIAAPIESSPQAICFRNIKGCDRPVVGNIFGTRRRLALSLGIPERELMLEVRRRISKPIPPTEVSSDEAPVHEVVLTARTPTSPSCRSISSISSTPRPISRRRSTSPPTRTAESMSAAAA